MKLTNWQTHVKCGNTDTQFAGRELKHRNAYGSLMALQCRQAVGHFRTFGLSKPQGTQRKKLWFLRLRVMHAISFTKFFMNAAKYVCFVNKTQTSERHNKCSAWRCFLYRKYYPIKIWKNYQRILQVAFQSPYVCLITLRTFSCSSFIIDGITT